MMTKELLRYKLHKFIFKFGMCILYNSAYPVDIYSLAASGWV